MVSPGQEFACPLPSSSPQKSLKRQPESRQRSERIMSAKSRPMQGSMLRSRVAGYLISRARQQLGRGAVGDEDVAVVTTPPTPKYQWRIRTIRVTPPGATFAVVA